MSTSRLGEDNSDAAEAAGYGEESDEAWIASRDVIPTLRNRQYARGSESTRGQGELFIWTGSAVFSVYYYCCVLLFALW